MVVCVGPLLHALQQLCKSINPSDSLADCLFVFPLIYKTGSVYLHMYLVYICKFVNQVHLSVYLSVCPSSCLSLNISLLYHV